MSNQTLQMTNSLYQYLLENSVRETKLQIQLREETATDEMSRMQIAPEQGQFLALLIQLTGAKKAIEVGTYTGYSALSIATSLPEDGQLICCDISEEWTTMGKRYWAKAGIDKKIDLRLAPALETLDKLIHTEKQSGTFDFAFIDADKENYQAYFDQCMTLIRPGGLITIDNVLWNGAVADSQKNDIDTVAIRTFNKSLLNDQRVDISLVPIADGVTLARKR